MNIDAFTAPLAAHILAPLSSPLPSVSNHDRSALVHYHYPRSRRMAAQFPPELFQNIIHFLTGGDMSFFPEENYRRYHEPSLELSKRELGACSLVCRYWAQHIRPKIFGRLTLRSRDDLLALIALAKSTFWPIGSGFRIGMYIWYLSLEQDIHSPSCIDLLLHLVPHRLFPGLASNNPGPAYYRIDVTFNGTRDSEGGRLEDKLKHCAPPTTYHGLPYQLPLPLSPVEKVRLANTMFRSFNSFMSFISGIAVQTLDIISVRFLDTELLDPHVPPNILQAKPRQIPNYVWVGECGLSWPFIWTITTCRAPLVNKFWRRGYTPAVYVSPSELAKLATLIKCVFDNCECHWCSHQSSTDEDARRQMSSFSIYRPGLGKPLSQQSPVLAIRKYVGTEVTHVIRVTLSMQGLVTALALEFFSLDDDYDNNPFSRPRELNIDWHTIDTLASQFTPRAPNPWALDIRVGTESMDDMRAFMPYVRSQMPLMQTVGRLGFWFTAGWDDKEIGYIWTQWTKDLEPVEDEEGAANAETGTTTETVVEG